MFFFQIVKTNELCPAKLLICLLALTCRLYNPVASLKARRLSGRLRLWVLQTQTQTQNPMAGKSTRPMAATPTAARHTVWRCTRSTSGRHPAVRSMRLTKTPTLINPIASDKAYCVHQGPQQSMSSTGSHEFYGDLLVQQRVMRLMESHEIQTGTKL